MIHKIADGVFVISSDDVWRPGAYRTRQTANYAFQFDDETLTRLQAEASARESAGYGGIITIDDLKRART